MRAPWLAQVLRDAGLTVHEIGGWRGRGRDMDAIYGVVVHDTVTPPSRTPAQDDRLIRDGHGTLPGPLYQLGVDRAGVVRLNADGRCNHNGHGMWGNNCIGIGAYCNGAGSPREPWNDAQRQTITVASRAILDRLQLGPSTHWSPRVAGHKETDPGRKQDPHNVNVGRLRSDVAALDLEDDMTPAESKMLREVHAQLTTGVGGSQTVRQKVYTAVDALGAMVPKVRELIARDPADVDLDLDALAAAVRDNLGDEIAEALGRRLTR